MGKSSVQEVRKRLPGRSMGLWLMIVCENLTEILRLAIFILLVLALYITFPAQLIRRAILLIFVFIIYPVAVLLIRKFWKFYHDRQKKDADDKIKALEKQKEEILETVMEKVSY